MAYYLGVDTSNYTTSVALYHDISNTIVQEKQLLPVKQGELGLRQSDAVFAHTKQIGALIQNLFGQTQVHLAGIGVSVRPRDADGSYMPCFLVGESIATAISAVTGAPLMRFSHQAGHVAAALFSTGHLDWMRQSFVAFHFSGGTTDCLLVRPGKAMPFEIELIAKSADLKAGQAIDRVGGMLGLPFPSGKHLEALALKSRRTYCIKPTFNGVDCCLSGLENQCRKRLDDGETYEDVAKFCLCSILAVARRMTDNIRAEMGEIPIIYAGGVMSNTILRQELEKFGAFAEPIFSADNAAGVAVLAHHAQQGRVL